MSSTVWVKHFHSSFLQIFLISISVEPIYPCLNSMLMEPIMPVCKFILPRTLVIIYIGREYPSNFIRWETYFIFPFLLEQGIRETSSEISLGSFLVIQSRSSSDLKLIGVIIGTVKFFGKDLNFRLFGPNFGRTFLHMYSIFKNWKILFKLIMLLKVVLPIDKSPFFKSC